MDLESSDLKLRDCHLSKLTRRDTLPVFFCLLSHSSRLRFQLFAPSNLWTGLSGKTAQPLSLLFPHHPCSADRGIIMTFGSGSNGCLGHGSLNDLSQVGAAGTWGRRKWGNGKERTSDS